MLRFRADAGARRRREFTYSITRKVGKVATAILESGDATAFPRDRSVIRDKGLPTKDGRTDTATGLTHTTRWCSCRGCSSSPDYGNRLEEDRPGPRWRSIQYCARNTSCADMGDLGSGSSRSSIR